jgi:glycine/D-amino acid oxidase-like deaminating enzyme
MHVVICGSGVIGACTAYFLSRRAIDVTVVERIEVAAARIETTWLARSTNASHCALLCFLLGGHMIRLSHRNDKGT